MSFAQPLFWQSGTQHMGLSVLLRIKYIVAALSKKPFGQGKTLFFSLPRNQKHSLNELHNLVAAFGYDAQARLMSFISRRVEVFFLRVLLEEAAQSNWSSSGACKPV